MQLVALLRLGFPSAPYLKYLTLLHTVTRWLVLQKARHHPHKGLWPVVGTWFQVLFHSPPGVLFTFPSRYSFTIGHQVVFSLMGWSPHIHTRFHVPRATLDTASLTRFSHTGLSPSMVCFSKTLLLNSLNRLCSPNPVCITTYSLGSSYFARHYSRNRIISFFSCGY